MVSNMRGLWTARFPWLLLHLSNGTSRFPRIGTQRPSFQMRLEWGRHARHLVCSAVVALLRTKHHQLHGLQHHHAHGTVPSSQSTVVRAAEGTDICCRSSSCQLRNTPQQTSHCPSNPVALCPTCRLWYTARRRAS
ncbi:hypothetical protein C7974DRAFT_396669 [Boeremia exigua]|uniref:uncharacterized protein n=1 Tax=Boeremia exigua TaxID=749465 RepID=UPI001E8EEC53|nr:uncharacterized protein C7974DRAFT_396669 [Boeremia exigua]KAH6625766.1 hypothetical protein C7974DRAFT_396669 [Boeremia exigua]